MKKYCRYKGTACEFATEYGYCQLTGCVKWNIIKEINDLYELPSAQLSVNIAPIRRGRWIRDDFGSRCKCCGLYAYRDKSERPWESPYCPNCGADMKKDGDQNG